MLAAALKNLNFEQRQVVYRWQGPLVVLAPVGTGKTLVMAHRTALAIKKGVNPKNILLLSFTNKAAREMGKRVESILGEKA
ncbi:UvrD-helicase domain-containing protein [Carboxydothermus pertinax]|uniref:ATP-dependent DNA helicase PcrA n=1 Tax=Carboxydothermus pertinax TaxID=870242 RepID=A0A1L8CXC7_9THEO|nr:UvrD-helicase domain-containing protein [Carboxydothermus pertinax]GAV23553.1 ATP-dependent DNA helicase PcrA [Carboxydothermus pertinax]